MQRGPILYCIEAVDNDCHPDCTIGAHPELTDRHETELLGDVVIVEADAGNGSRLTAIPFYARDNRDGPPGCRSGDSTRNMDSCVTANTAFMLYYLCVTGRELLKLLRTNGWQIDRIRGSHHIMTKGTKTVSVPVHGSKDLPRGTVNAILKEAGIR